LTGGPRQGYTFKSPIFFGFCSLIAAVTVDRDRGNFTRFETDIA